MKRTIKAILGAAAVIGGCAVLSACAGTTIDLNEYVITDFSGYNTAGTANARIDFESLCKDYELLDEEGDQMTLLASMGLLAEEVNGKLDKNEELSNGDTVTFEWNDVDTEALKKQFSVNFKFSSIEVPVEGLEEPKPFDPFEYLTVTFEGFSPNGKVNLNRSSDIPFSMAFTASKTEGLKNGETITVTAGGELSELKKACIRQGLLISENEKTYTVEGLSAYVTELRQIPDDVMQKIIRQSEDIIKADCAGWTDNTLDSTENIGCYFFKAKEGFSNNPYNSMFCVFRNVANMSGYTLENQNEITSGKDEYYTYVYFSDFILLPDGTCTVDLSKGTLCDNRCNSTYGYNSYFTWYFYTFNGYNDLDSLFNNVVTPNIATYDYVSTINQ